jgi:hypothetical protein
VFHVQHERPSCLTTRELLPHPEPGSSSPLLSSPDETDDAELRSLVLDDLHRAQRLIIRHQAELDPQWRIASPAGDYYIAPTLQSDTANRAIVLDAIALFMAWKSATAFTVAAELHEPRSLSCTLVTPTLALAVLTPINATSLPVTADHFGPPAWLSSESIDPALIALLPRAPRPLTPKAISGLEKWFGTTGLYPAYHLTTGRLGL